TPPPAPPGGGRIRSAPCPDGFNPLSRHNSLPVAGSWPVTTSAPLITISVPDPVPTIAGGEDASGDSWTAVVGRSIFQRVRPVFLSIRITYEGSSVFMPCSTCTYNEFS